MNKDKVIAIVRSRLGEPMLNHQPVVAMIEDTVREVIRPLQRDRQAALEGANELLTLEQTNLTQLKNLYADLTILKNRIGANFGKPFGEIASDDWADNASWPLRRNTFETLKQMDEVVTSIVEDASSVVVSHANQLKKLAA